MTRKYNTFAGLILKILGLTGFDSIVLCKYKHVARCVISALI